jgi:hypothetical protein
MCHRCPPNTLLKDGGREAKTTEHCPALHTFTREPWLRAAHLVPPNKRATTRIYMHLLDVSCPGYCLSLGTCRSQSGKMPRHYPKIYSFTQSQQWPV